MSKCDEDLYLWLKVSTQFILFVRSVFFYAEQSFRSPSEQCEQQGSSVLTVHISYVNIRLRTLLCHFFYNFLMVNLSREKIEIN